MSPPTNETPPGPDQLFVIACPVCRGHVAASGRLGGRGAYCPLCANLFQVPVPVPPAAVTPASGTAGPALAEDWGGVIEQLAPRAKTVAAAPATEQPPPAGFTLAAERAEGAAMTREPAAEAPAKAAVIDAALAVAQPNGGDEPTATETEPRGSDSGSEAATFVMPAEPAPVVNLVLDDAPPPAAPVDPAALPRTEPGALDPQASELAFREPVRTIRQGGEVIEIRRLTPEERRSRRFRRNLMMIVVGVSILLVIVLLFGVPTAPKK
jgi:hypothetical protein